LAHARGPSGAPDLSADLLQEGVEIHPLEQT
jgi:hypothetical protein